LGWASWVPPSLVGDPPSASLSARGRTAAERLARDQRGANGIFDDVHTLILGEAIAGHRAL
jgi:hypothetical protein